MPKIGVFDSGIGGVSVAKTIQAALPAAQVLFVNDAKNIPYGTKTPDQLFDLVLPLLTDLATKVEVIVVACNTVSTTLISRLRDELSVPLIAMEPMVKPAAESTKSGTVVICATPTTLTSQRYQWLKQTYAKNVQVLEPDCSDWAELIERNELNDHKLRSCIEPALKQGADVVVLGCTHYHWIEEEITQIADEYDAKVLQPELPVVAELRRVLALSQ